MLWCWGVLAKTKIQINPNDFYLLRIILIQLADIQRANHQITNNSTKKKTFFPHEKQLIVNWLFTKRKMNKLKQKYHSLLLRALTDEVKTTENNYTENHLFLFTRLFWRQPANGGKCHRSVWVCSSVMTVDSRSRQTIDWSEVGSGQQNNCIDCIWGILCVS